MLRVDGEIFESGKKKLRSEKYPNACERDLRLETENWEPGIMSENKFSEVTSKIQNGGQRQRKGSKREQFGAI